MRSFSARKAMFAISLVGWLSMLAAPGAFAAPVTYTFDFAAAPDGVSGSGDGNELQYYDIGTGTSLARVTSWYVGTTPGATLAQATGHFLNDGADVGLGICNAEEAANCLSKDNKRGITESVGTDWILVMFDQTMNLSTLTMSPDLAGKKDQWADVTFYTGFLGSAGDLLGASYSDLTTTLGLSEFSYLNGGKTSTDVSVDINMLAGGEVWGNAILIGPSLDPAGGADRLLLNNISTVVPIPAAAWLLLSALSVLFGQKKWADRKSA